MAPSDSTRPSIPNPYDKTEAPVLYSAWRDGYRASTQGKTAPSQTEYRNTDVSNAWVNGYTAAELVQADSTNNEGDVTPGSGYIRVVVVDDHPAIHQAVRGATENTIDVLLSGEATSVAEGLQRIEDLHPDVALIDLSLPDGHGLDLIHILQAHSPLVKTVVFSMYDETIYAKRAIQAGALGYVMKTKPSERLMSAIRTARRGEIDLSRKVTSRVFDKIDGNATPIDALCEDLTNRELQVLEMIGKGRSLPEIQRRLNLKRKTVETYRRRAKEKLGLERVSDLLQYAVAWAHGRRNGTDPSHAKGEE